MAREVTLFKDPHCYAGIWIAMIQCRGFKQQVSPNYTYKSALINWCKKNGYKIKE